MIILNVVPKDIHVTIELSLVEVNRLLDFLNRCEVKYNKEEEMDFVESSDFVTRVFFPKLNQLSEDLKDRENVS